MGAMARGMQNLDLEMQMAPIPAGERLPIPVPIPLTLAGANFPPSPSSRLTCCGVAPLALAA